MLNINDFRRIKPVDSVDDYEAGATEEKINPVVGKEFLNSILSLVSDTWLSVTEVANATGRSRSAVHSRLYKQEAIGTVKSIPRTVAGSIRPVLFYKGVNAA
ncbi:MAG TPA: hypothetical protein EYN67_12350 [Flavobacteriales bacterium]|nr:hypothetical protein [Methylococcaceae bacterium]HHZ96313.1 hypothetical protein [Flavobacteriales bacterium]